MRKILTIILIVFAIMICILMVKSNNIKYNNTIHKESLITTTYSHSEIEKLQFKISCGRIYLEDLENEFKIECMRKTYEGYYFILKQDDGKDVFVFTDSNYQLKNILILADFKEQKDFEQSVTKGMTKSEVLAYDSDIVPNPFAGVHLTIHPIKEGTYFVWYRRDIDGRLLEEPIVESMKFYEIGENAEGIENMERKYVPYILKIDREE